MISVVIPLYNKEKSIKNTIQCVLNQTFTDFEIVVVNDGSTDKSVEVVKSIDDKRIRIINKENGGVSSARNRGIEEAKNEWIAFLDGDDFWEPNYLEEMINLIFDFPNAGMYGSSFDLFDNGKFINPKKTIFPMDFYGYVDDYFTIALTDILYWTSATIVSKKKIIKIGGFDERISMGEDQDLWIRMALNFRVVYLNIVLAHYNQSASNRAMKRKFDFSKNFLCYTNKFAEWEKIDEKFNCFINNLRVRYIMNLLHFYSIRNQELNKFIKEINIKVISFRWKVFLKLPLFIKKCISSFYFILIDVYLIILKKNV